MAASVGIAIEGVSKSFGAMQALGNKIDTMYNNVSNHL